ncbi:MAG: YdbL family protein [Alphaproteobacteria bacterium]|nr:YdbL family protein [Alphaproteobacteria bacterium]
MSQIAAMVRSIALVMALVFAAAPGALAEGALDGYKAQGLVGERPDGFAGVVGSSASADVVARVRAVNAARREEYARIAKSQGTSIEAVQAVFGQKLVDRVPAGQYYMSPSGQWVKK